MKALRHKTQSSSSGLNEIQKDPVSTFCSFVDFPFGEGEVITAQTLTVLACVFFLVPVSLNKMTAAVGLNLKGFFEGE